MTFTTDQILELYKSEAGKHGLGGTSTIQDPRTRELEVAALFSYLRDGIKILEIGCGNGYTAQRLVEHFDVQLDAVDFSPEMIAIAQQRNIERAKGRVQFAQQDVLKLENSAEYETVFTERCVQNLTTWEDQKIGLANIARALKPKGEFVMLESFTTGLNKMNDARKELDLPAVPMSWHNLYFDEEQTKAYLKEIGLEYRDQNRFLSGYYFGSRVLLPALAPKGKPITSKSVLNDYFCSLPPAGDFCPMKIMRFIKA